MNALLLVLLALPLPSVEPTAADPAVAVPAAEAPCADVFDRTPECAAVDAEALPTPVDPVPPLEVQEDDVGISLGWQFLAGSAVAALVAGGAGVGAFWYDTQLAALRSSGTATPAAVDDILWQRSAAQIGAGAMLLVSGMLAGTSVAFLVFNPSEGRPREPFRIEE